MKALSLQEGAKLRGVGFVKQVGFKSGVWIWQNSDVYIIARLHRMHCIRYRLLLQTE